MLNVSGEDVSQLELAQLKKVSRDTFSEIIKNKVGHGFTLTEIKLIESELNKRGYSANGNKIGDKVFAWKIDVYKLNDYILFNGTSTEEVVFKESKTVKAGKAISNVSFQCMIYSKDDSNLMLNFELGP